MPIPSLLQRIHDEGFQQGLREGFREVGRGEIIAEVLRGRFGLDERISAITRRLANLDPDDSVARISAAASLDDLASRVRDRAKPRR